MSKIVGKVLRINGFTDAFTIESEHYPSLNEMHTAVGGYIERVRLSEFATFEDLPIEPLVMVVDEEGLVKKKPMNVKACMLAQRPIVGDVIIMPARYFR